MSKHKIDLILLGYNFANSNEPGRPTRAVMGSPHMPSHNLNKLVREAASGADVAFAYEFEKKMTSEGPALWLIFCMHSAHFKHTAQQPFAFSPLNEGQSLSDESFRKWFELLQNQSALFFLPTLKSSGQSCTPAFPVLKGRDFKRFLGHIKWFINQGLLHGPSFKAEKALKQAHEEIRDSQQNVFDLVSYYYETGRRTYCFNALQRGFIQSVEDRLPPPKAASIIRQTAQEVQASIKKWLVPHLAQGLAFDSKDSLVNPEHVSLFISSSPDPLENIYRNYFFCLLFLTDTDKNGIVKIPIGLQEDGKSYVFKHVHKTKIINQFIDVAEAYRYILGGYWWELIDETDELLPFLDYIDFHAIGLGSGLDQAEQLTGILRHTALKQRFFIDRRTTIVINKIGCKEISFVQGRNPSEILFKLVVAKEPSQRNNLVLCGRLNLHQELIEWVGPEDQKQHFSLNLLLFLVAIAYRDLTVVRERLPEGEESSTPRQQRQPGRGFSGKNGSTRKPSKELRIMPRLEGGTLQELANPRKFEQTVRTITPHTRCPHLRTLPDGYKASERQKELATSLGYNVPEGKTFVKAVEISGGTSEMRVKLAETSLLEVLFYADKP